MSRNIQDSIDLLIENDETICSKYELIQKIGEGCFGKIYKVKNKLKKIYSALKVQYIDKTMNKRSTLLNEVQILKKLNSEKGIPKMIASGKWQYGFYLQLQLLKSSLHDEKLRDYSILQINNMARELILILKKIHDYDIIHQDLKPQNIMKDLKGNLYLIDFGLSVTRSYSKQHNKRRGFIGTPRYASIAAHKGKPQTPKDDLESVLYVLAYLYLKKLPWLKVNVSKDKKLDQIMKLKQIASQQFFKSISNGFFYAYEYIRELKHNEIIDYDFLINLFLTKRNTFSNIKASDISNKNTRRKSQLNNCFMFENTPTILINKVEKTQNEPIENILQNQNFSEMAQDGYMEMLQILTEKILGTEQHIEFDYQSNNLSLGQQPKVHKNMSKYFQTMVFKNPFVNPPV